MAYIYTPMSTFISRAQTHIHLGVCFFLALLGALPLYIQTRSCLLEIWLMTHAAIIILTLDCLHKHTFLCHAYRRVFLTRNLRTYFTSVGRVFLGKTVILQTVLWNIRVWSSRFLVRDVYSLQVHQFIQWFNSYGGFRLFPSIELTRVLALSVRILL